MTDPDVVVRLLAAIDEREREYHRCAEELREAARAKVRLPHTEFLRATVGDGLRLCQSHRDIVAEYRRVADRREEIAQKVRAGVPVSAEEVEEVPDMDQFISGISFAVVAVARGYGIEEETTDGE